jgi:peptide methionine sulfoxide reductase msrA/msrB
MRKKRLLGGLAGFLVLVSVVVALALPNLATAGFQYVAGSGLDAEELGKPADSSAPVRTDSSDVSEPWVSDTYDVSNLSRMEYYVTQRNGTEPPFSNKYFDHNRTGIYVDVVSGEPLFSSRHKFRSGTGWPHFYKPIEPGNIRYVEEEGALDNRIELRSRYADSHLGHLFRDGIAKETPTGLRYCVNSAALDFVPVEQLEERGYGEYASQFQD